MKKTHAIVVKRSDGKLFAFAKDYPAAAVSASNLNDLFDRLKLALADVMKYEEFDYKVEKL